MAVEIGGHYLQQEVAIELVALGLAGPKKAVTRLTGNLKLYR